jgi:branched-chain amino acid transport system permease protein
VIRFQQRPIEDLPPNRRSNIGIARTFQNLKLFSGMTVLENVIVGGYSTQRAGFLANLLGWMSVREEERRLRAKAMEILHFVNLARYANEPAISLPYGLQRKLEIARAIVSDPVLLLLDEPAAGLNPAETAQLMTLISSIRDRGVTVLLIEHHMEMVMAISDNIVVLDYGAKISEGAPDHVRNDPAVINAYLGADPDEDNPGAAAPFSTPQAAR